jgi:hypothetical protein
MMSSLMKRWPRRFEAASFLLAAGERAIYIIVDARFNTASP